MLMQPVKGEGEFGDDAKPRRLVRRRRWKEKVRSRVSTFSFPSRKKSAEKAIFKVLFAFLHEAGFCDRTVVSSFGSYKRSAVLCRDAVPSNKAPVPLTWYSMNVCSVSKQHLARVRAAELDEGLTYCR